MKKQVIQYAIFGIILVILCAVVVKSCTITDRYSKLLGEFTTLKGIATENARIAEERIGSALATIDNLTGDNEELTKHIELTESELVNTDEDVVRLEGELVTIRHQAETIPNLREQVVNLEGQLNIWKDKFTLATKIIADKDAIIFNMIDQYELQLGVSAEYKDLYETQIQLTDRGYTLLNIAERKIRTARFGGTIKTIAIGAIGGYMAYQLVKGK